MTRNRSGPKKHRQTQEILDVHRPPLPLRGTSPLKGENRGNPPATSERHAYVAMGLALVSLVLALVIAVGYFRLDAGDRSALGRRGWSWQS